MSKICKQDLSLSSFDSLENIEKQTCPECGRMRMYFCYDCVGEGKADIPMAGVYTPQVTLPCSVDVIKHPKEKSSKSTSLHCKILAPSQTRVFSYPDVFDYRNEPQDEEGSTVLVFPSPTAVSIEEFVKKNGKIKRFVVLDCTWFQVGVMQRIPQIQGLPCVILKDYVTTFWRPQHNVNESHLATIEAIYYALKEYNDVTDKSVDPKSLDNLLFWFIYTREKVDAKALERDNRIQMNSLQSKEV